MLPINAMITACFYNTSSRGLLLAAPTLQINLVGFIFVLMAATVLTGGAVSFFRTWIHKRSNHSDRDQSEDDQAGKPLQQDETMFRTLADISAVGAFIIQDNYFCYTSPTWDEMTGFSSAELGKMKLLDLIHADMLDEMRTRLAEHVADCTKREQTEIKIQAKDGRARWLNLATANIEYQNRPAMLGAALDITQQKEGVVALQSSEDRYRKLIESSPDGIFIESQGIVTYINPAGVRLFRAKSVDQIVGKRLVEITRLESGQLLEEGLTKLEAGLDVNGYVQRFTALDGTEIVVEISTTPLVQDRVPSVLFIGHDITELKKAEALQQKRAEELSALYETSLEITASLDLDGLLESITERAARLLNAHMGFLMMADDDDRSLSVVVSYNVSKSRVGTRFEPGEGLAGLVLQTGELVEVSDYSAWENHSKKFEDLGFRRTIGVPLKIGQRVLGVIMITDGEEVGFFDEAEARLVCLFADQAAIAIENARVYEQLQTELHEREESERAQLHLVDELTALNAVALIGNQAVSLDDLIERVTQIIGEKLYCDDFGIGLVSADGTAICLHPSYHIHQGEINPAIHLGEGIIGWVAQQKRAYCTSDVWDDPIYISANPEIRSELCVPILLGERLLGVINAESTHREAYSDADVRLLSGLAEEMSTAIDKVYLFEAERKRRKEAEVLRDSSAALVATLDLNQILDSLLTSLAKVVPYDSSCVMLVFDGMMEITAERGFRSEQQSITTIEAMTYQSIEVVIKQAKPLIIPDVRNDSRWSATPATKYIQSWMGVPLIVKDKVIGLINIDNEKAGAYTEEDALLALAFANQAASAIENARLFDAEYRRSRELSSVAEVSAAVRKAENRAEIIPIILDQAMELLYGQGAVLMMTDLNGAAMQVELGRGCWSPLTGQRLEMVESLAQKVIDIHQPYEYTHGNEDPIFKHITVFQDVKNLICVPLVAQDLPLGMIILGRNRNFLPDEVELLSAIGDIAASAIHRTTLHEQTVQRLQRLTTLRTVDLAITASADSRLTMDILLDETITSLNLDAVEIYTYNSMTRTLQWRTGRGTRNPQLTHNPNGIPLVIPIDRNQHQRTAVVERRTIIIPELKEENDERIHLLLLEGFVSAIYVPFVAKGQVKGLMEVYQRKPLTPDREWMDFLESLAGQAAIALDNIELFDGLERTNMELSLAYDATIEGWSNALDLRDHDTEGHSKNVSEKTVELARAMGIPENQLVNIKRGALLHDIGKMAIPDSILLKPGPLTEDEWVIMRQHPVYAYNWLSSINFLRDAIEIPYCHHEKWDGTGYPRRLKGDVIPLPARIFAVIDVWEALSNDRVYRKAWSDEKVESYIREQAGHHFDPEVVNCFFHL